MNNALISIAGTEPSGASENMIYILSNYDKRKSVEHILKNNGYEQSTIRTPCKAQGIEFELDLPIGAVKGDSSFRNFFSKSGSLVQELVSSTKGFQLVYATNKPNEDATPEEKAFPEHLRNRVWGDFCSAGTVRTLMEDEQK